MDILTTLWANLGIGLGEALTLANLWYCFVGVFLGCFVGVLPGLGSLIAISLLLPITYHLPATGALIMLAGVYFGADYGGGTCSILLGVPGHPGAAVDVLDGYPMSKQGRGGIALFMKCVASFWGSTVGIVLLMMFAPILSEFALKFGPTEYCSLMLLGLIAASTVGQGSPIKGVGMLVLGMVLSCVGTDVNSGAVRYDFGLLELSDGIGLLPIAMGLFAISEVVNSVGHSSISVVKQKFGLRDQLPTREDWQRSWMPMLRGSAIGSFLEPCLVPAAAWRRFWLIRLKRRSPSIPSNLARAPSRALPRPRPVTTPALALRSSRP